MESFKKLAVEVAHVERARRAEDHIEGLGADVPMLKDLLSPYFRSLAIVANRSIIYLRFDHGPLGPILLRAEADVRDSVFSGFVYDSLRWGIT